MILNVFDGNLGLPTVDIKSLQMMAFVKFMNIEVDLRKKTLKPYLNDELPELICDEGPITSLENFFKYIKLEAAHQNKIKQNQSSLDIRFKPYEFLFKETIKPAYINTYWLDENNYCEVTRGVFSKVSSFPLNYFVPSFIRKNYLNQFNNLYPLKSRKNYFDLDLIDNAKNVLKLLSNELGDKKYFNNESPNEIDALIFGYLAIILYIEVPKMNNLNIFLKENNNLVDYVNRILSIYFKGEFVKQDLKINKEQFEQVSWKKIFYITFLALSANAIYLLYVIKSKEEEKSDDEEEDDY